MERSLNVSLKPSSCSPSNAYLGRSLGHFIFFLLGLQETVIENYLSEALSVNIVTSRSLQQALT